ncbi:GAF domain-containing protein, partial [bacterium]|nr:GAF domain-containing protein [bacterium]
MMNEKPKIPTEIFAQWQTIVEILAQVIHVPSAIITRLDMPLIEVLKASRNTENPYKEGLKVELANHYCEYVITKKEKLRMPDARQSAEWNQAPEIDYGMVSYLGMPICWPEGEVFGTICVLDSKENHYTEYEKILEQFRSLIESHLAILFKNQQLEHQHR